MTIDIPTNIKEKCPPKLAYSQAEAAELEQQLMQRTSAHLLISPWIGEYSSLMNGSWRNVVSHVANMVLRKEWGYVKEESLTFDDTVIIAIAVEKRRVAELKSRSSYSKRLPLFSYIPRVNDTAKQEIIGRATSYLLPFFAGSLYKDEDPEILRLCIASEFDPKVTKVSIAKRIGLSGSSASDMVGSRRVVVREADRASLGLLQPGMRPSQTLTTGNTYVTQVFPTVWKKGK